MKKLIVLLAFALTACNMATNNEKTGTVEPLDATIADFTGDWALDLDYPDNNAGWLEITTDKGYVDASLLWRWASVYPAEFALIVKNQVVVTQGHDVVRQRDADDKPVKVNHAINWLNVFKTSEDSIRGQAFFPSDDGKNVEIVNFKGKRIPPVGPAPDLSALNYGEPIQLFNGENLDGWELLNKNAVNGWSVEDGVLINNPVQHEGEAHINYGNLRTTDTFEDFRLQLDVNVPAESNSGIYLRGIYEVQVFDSYGKGLDSHYMGALYSRITPSVSAEKPGGEWQHFDITLADRHLTVILNGTKIIDNQPIKGVTGGAMTADEFSPGPIYLQGDHGTVSYKNIVLTPIVK